MTWRDAGRAGWKSALRIFGNSRLGTGGMVGMKRHFNALLFASLSLFACSKDQTENRTGAAAPRDKRQGTIQAEIASDPRFAFRRFSTASGAFRMLPTVQLRDPSICFCRMERCWKLPAWRRIGSRPGPSTRRSQIRCALSKTSKPYSRLL